MSGTSVREESYRAPCPACGADILISLRGGAWVREVHEPGGWAPSGLGLSALCVQSSTLAPPRLAVILQRQGPAR